jgi:hypothetical protein
MVEDKSQRDPVPEHFADLEAAAEFWDTHDLADYEDLTGEVQFTVNLQRHRRLVALEPGLANKLAAEARKRGLSAESLVNLTATQREHGPSRHLPTLVDRVARP